MVVNAPVAGRAHEATATAQAPRLFRITTPQRTDRKLKMLVYGQPGIGKTTFAASAVQVAAMRDVLVLDAEAGDLSLAGWEGVDIIPIAHWPEFDLVHEFLRTHCRLRDAGDLDGLRKLAAEHLDDVDPTAPPKQYRTVIVDSLTEIQKYVMNHQLGIRVGRTSLNTTFQNPEFKDWNQSSAAISHLVRSFRDLRMHVVFVCAEAQSEDEAKRSTSRPALPGRLATDIPGNVDVVGFMEENGRDKEGNTLRRMYLQPTRAFIAKSRLQGLKQPYIDNPTMADVYRGSQVPPASSGPPVPAHTPSETRQPPPADARRS